jgi:hypothetical protein
VLTVMVQASLAHIPMLKQVQKVASIHLSMHVTGNYSMKNVPDQWTVEFPLLKRTNNNNWHVS